MVTSPGGGARGSGGRQSPQVGLARLQAPRLDGCLWAEHGAWTGICGQSAVWPVSRALPGPVRTGRCPVAGDCVLGPPPCSGPARMPTRAGVPHTPAACEPGLCPQATHSAGLRGSPAASPTWPRVAWTPSPQPGGRCLQGLRGAGFQRGKQADPGQLPVGRLLRKPSVQAY